MRNMILKYEMQEIDNYIVSDYTSTKIDIYNFLYEFQENGTFGDFFDLYRISDDDKLERISYSLYGTPDYWDVLLQLNDRNPLFDLPYNLDTLIEFSEEFWNNYSNNIYFQSPLISNILQERIDEEIEKMKERNEIYRYIYVIKPSKINEFVKILRDKDYI